MNIGFMGLGKLGLPCAMAIEAAGHRVIGYDPDPRVAEILSSRQLPYKEIGAQELLDGTKIELVSPSELVSSSDIVFVAVQTPHDPRFEGVGPLPDERRDFDYKYLQDAMIQLSDAADAAGSRVTVAVISTVLPGTMAREIVPFLSDNITLCYNPFFIAMGTAINDFLNPEFVLLGSETGANDLVRDFYKSIHARPVFECTVEEAELTKVTYNTYIGAKIAFANTIMELSDKLDNVSCDRIIDALSLATDRLMSAKYLRGGMGDGGGCHPRDNIALSWLAKKHDLSFDFFEAMMQARENQTKFLADLAIDLAVKKDLDVIVLGKAFKSETNLTVGSPATLMVNFMASQNLAPGKSLIHYDPHVDKDGPKPPEQWPRAVYFIATKHECFKSYKFPRGSYVIDPWRYLPDMPGIVIHRVGSRH